MRPRVVLATLGKCDIARQNTPEKDEHVVLLSKITPQRTCTRVVAGHTSTTIFYKYRHMLLVICCACLTLCFPSSHANTKCVAFF